MKPESYRLVEAPRKSHLSDRFFGRFARVGLRGALADTNRTGSAAEVPGEAAIEGIAWQQSDQNTKRWFPQGITTSADAYGPDPNSGLFEGRPVIVVSWYAHGPLGYLLLGSRISVIDYSDPEAPTYRHVLLTAPRRWGFFRLFIIEGVVVV